MKIEIWSDVVCPFCYIGKRHLEKALENFPEKDQVEIEWKSFLLNPDLVSKPGQTITQYLSEAKGISLERAKELNDHVTDMAKESGLEYNLRDVVVANSFNAHRVIQLAKTKGLGEIAEELFFKSYFCEAKNIDDNAVLIEVGTQIGLDKNELESLLSGDDFSTEVNSDYQESAQLGIRGVPFFVIDRKFGISGAQPIEVFENTLVKAIQQQV